MATVLDQEQTQLYADYGMDNAYTFVSGTFALPVADEGDTESPVDVVTAFRPYRIRNLSFSAKKSSTPPVIPAPESVGAFSFLGGEISVPTPLPLPNYQFQWEVTGQLTFICTAADSDGLILGNRPMIFEQQTAVPVVAATDSMPEDVQQSGRGPIAGYQLGQQLDLNNPNYLYPEITYFPSVFFSTSLLSGPASYPEFS